MPKLNTTPRYYTPYYYQEEIKEQEAIPIFLKSFLSDIGLDTHFKSIVNSSKNTNDISVNDKTRHEIIQETINEGGSFEDVLGMMFSGEDKSDDSKNIDKNNYKPSSEEIEIIIGRNLATNNTLRLSINNEEDANLSYGDYLIMLNSLKDGLRHLFDNVRNTRVSLTFPDIKRDEKMMKRGVYAAISIDIEYFAYDDIIETTIVALGKRDVIRMVDVVDSLIRATPDRIEFINKHGKTL